MRQILLLGLLSAYFQALTLVHAAVREEWVQHFDGGFPAKTNHPFVMQLDSAGNIYVVGSAANASKLLDYVTLKYTPSGTLLWFKRFGSTNGLSNLPRAIGLDTNDNLYVTGTSATVKYSSGGDELWTAPYAGRGLTVHGTNIYVTGFSETEFATASLSIDGILGWLKKYTAQGRGYDYSQSVFCDDNQFISVVGCVSLLMDARHIYRFPYLLKYDRSGNQVMETYLEAGWAIIPNQCLKSAIQGKSGGLYLLGEMQPNDYPFQCLARTSDGAKVWNFLGYPTADGAVVSSGMESRNSFCLAGSFFTDSHGVYDPPGTLYFGVVQVKADGGLGWRTDFPGVFTDGNQALGLPGLAEAICVDNGERPTATGLVYLANDMSSANIATAKYDASGTLLWSQQFNGAANGYDEGKAIVTDSSGNVYVAGLSTTLEGGTEIVLIKYTEYTAVEKSPSGSMLLQFPGTPGQPYKVQATTNFPNWLDIGLGTAAPNGLLQFEDTNAMQYPFRFYHTVTPTP